MAYTITHTVVKNPTKAMVQRLRQIGLVKAQRLEKMKEHWENGDYENVEVIRL